MSCLISTCDVCPPLLLNRGVSSSACGWTVFVLPSLGGPGLYSRLDMETRMLVWPGGGGGCLDGEGSYKASVVL